jgi:hypothetical protein
MECPEGLKGILVQAEWVLEIDVLTNCGLPCVNLKCA